MATALRWVRKRGPSPLERRRFDVSDQDWHLEAETYRGMVVTACGLNLGDPLTELEVVEDESQLGHRCPSCQGAALRYQV